MKYSEKRNEFIKEKYRGFPLLNFKGDPGVPLLNFEGGPRVPLLYFRGVSRPTFGLSEGSRIQGPRVQIPGVRVPLLHHA